MKKILSTVLLLLALGSVAHAFLRDDYGRFRKPETFQEEFYQDTQREFGKSWNAGYIFGAVGSDSRGSVGTTILAWKFLSLDCALTNTMKESNAKTDFEIQFPIRLERIPIGKDKELGDLFYDEDSIGGWYDHLKLRIVLSQGLASGLFGFGFKVGVEF